MDRSFSPKGTLSGIPKVVVDASSLIVLAKLDAIQTLYKTYGLIGITETVYEEVVEEGKRLGQEDALVVERAIYAGFIVRLSLTPEQRQFAEAIHAEGEAYGRGECESIAYAKASGILFLVEDRKAKSLAKAQDVSYTVLQVFPLEGFIQGKLDLRECLDLMDRIGVAMNTDIAILNGLKAAAEAIDSARRKEGS